MNSLKKYPRSVHLPFSPGATKDDRILSSLDCFKGKNIIVSWKKDGENSTLYKDYSHARSLDSVHHYSRDWLKAFHSTFKNDIPEGWRICGENLFATHTIHYTDLKSYFYGFSIWNEHNICLSWKETLEWFNLLGIVPVEVIYEGIFDEDYLRNIDIGNEEGFVIRNVDSFHYDSFSENLAKYVRAGFVPNGEEHWKNKKVIPNKLCNS